MAAGRPTKYKEEFAKQAYKICLLKNATDKELAEIFDVEESTIYLWKINYPEFSEALKEGKEIADAQVAKKLYDKATGWTREWVNADGEAKKEYFAPDTTAQIFWLKNRQSKKWRDKQELEHSGKLEYELVLPEELGEE